ncbi:MAG: hypothetical protein F6K55_09955 [Moorea sp. SIO4A3]|nr:hypothetical protein [Moorena sp. SIO4A3]
MANDVTIQLFNNTGDPQTFVVFNQDPDLKQIFQTVFPTAWRIFNVGATGGRASVILPIQYQIGAGDLKDAFTGSVSNVQNTEAGDRWKFTTNTSGSFELLPEGEQSDNSIACVNETGQFVTMSMVKSNRPLLTYPEIGDGAVATFQPINYIYLAWYNNIVEGNEIAAAISQPQAIGVNLDGANTIEGTLSKNNNTGRLSWEIKVNGRVVDPVAEAVDNKPALSVTESFMKLVAC